MAYSLSLLHSKRRHYQLLDSVLIHVDNQIRAAGLVSCVFFSCYLTGAEGYLHHMRGRIRDEQSQPHYRF